MDGAGAPRPPPPPGHAALDREVELEGRGAVACSGGRRGRPGRQPVAGDLGDGAPARGRRRPRRRRGARPASAPAAPSRSARRARAIAAASASAIACEPPAATGQPKLWQAAASAIPTAALSGRVSGLKEWAAAPPNSARAAGAASRRASSVAGASAGEPEAGQPQRVARAGAGPAADVLGELVEAARPTARTGAARRGPSSPSPAAVSSIERTIAARRCRRRAGGPGRPPASATRARAAPAPASGSEGEPPPSGARPSRRRG